MNRRQTLQRWLQPVGSALAAKLFYKFRKLGDKRFGSTCSRQHQVCIKGIETPVLKVDRSRNLLRNHRMIFNYFEGRKGGYKFKGDMAVAGFLRRYAGNSKNQFTVNDDTSSDRVFRTKIPFAGRRGKNHLHWLLQNLTRI